MDDGTAYTTVGHAGLAICNPIASEALDRVVSVACAGLGPEARVLDVGCGKGEFLVRAVVRSGGTGLGVDPNPVFLAEARAAVEARAPGRVRFIEGNPSTHPPEPGAYDVAAVVGATHAFGGTRETLAALAATTRRGGRVVLGDGTWHRPPPDAAIAALGMDRDELGTLDELLETVRSFGLAPVHVETATEHDWAAYESAHRANVESHARERADDAQAARLLARSRAWRLARSVAGLDLFDFSVVVADRA
jgi:cyclopropane fatty-acyl-phospholipid synthase-like methyltransferase